MTVSTAPTGGSRRAARAPLAPGPRFATPLGFVRELRRNLVTFLERTHAEYGDVVCIRMGGLRSYLVADPDAAKHVLVDNHRAYRKGIVFQKLRRVAGDGLILSEGELWKRQRRLVAPAFGRARLRQMAPRVEQAIADLVARWERERAGGEPFDVLPEMSKLALDAVSRAMFGVDVLGRADAFHDTVNDALGYADQLVNSYFVAPMWVPTARNRGARRTLAELDDMIRSIVRSHRESGEDRGDLLSMLLSARDADTGEAMSEQLLLDEMRTFLVAGHETTAVALAWAIHLLGRHPEAAWRLQEEVDALGQPPRMEDLPKLGFTRRVVDESLRLYPPAVATNREALEEDRLGPWRVPRRANVSISIGVLHRHPAHWDEPDRFDPDRFLPERSEGRPRLAYLPFGAGPRRCVGEDFALLEATLALAALYRRFDLAPVSTADVRPRPMLTLRPAEPIRVSARLRA